MIQTLTLLGSCGSIGRQALEVCRVNGIRPLYLASGRNVRLLAEQIRNVHPLAVSLAGEEEAEALCQELKGESKPDILWGEEGMCELARRPADMVLGAVSGFAGLPAVAAALESGRRLALANKETLVAAGGLVMDLARKKGIEIFPVDSEHSAIWQCLQGNRREDLRRIWLTASGGPFRGKKAEELEKMTACEALAHPVWSMGAKISIDSATMMNKGLERIEAMHLFQVQPKDIEILVHPEGAVHSAVEYADGEIIAQMGPADMRLAIQLAFSWPERVDGGWPRFDWFSPAHRALHFEEPDERAFPCLRLAREAAEAGAAFPLVLNAANEEAVSDFLKGRIGFMEIARLVEKALEHFAGEAALTLAGLDAIIDLNARVRAFVRETV